MKINKLIAVSMTAITVFQASGYAAEPRVEANQTPYTDNINVKISNANVNEPISVRITNAEGEKDFYEMGYADADGNFVFSYINDKHSGEMYIDVQVGRKRITGSYFKMGDEMYDEFINTVKEQHNLQGTGTPDGDAIKAIFDKYDGKFGLEKTAFDTFSEEQQKNVYNVMANDTSFKDKINEMKDVIDAFYAAILVESYKEDPDCIKSMSQISPYKEVIEAKDFAPVLVSSINAASNSVLEKVFTSVPDNCTDSKKLFQDIEFRIFKTSIMDAGSWNDVKVMFSLYKDLLGIDPNIADIDDYKALIGVSYSAYADYANAFQTQILKENNNSGGSSGGNAGGGIGIISSVKPSTNNNGFQHAEEDLTGKLVFDDLSDAMWAIKAVTYVWEKGIISGVGDGRFEPNRYITRAEAAKIIVAMLGDEDGGEIPFEDIRESDWFYPYVSVAYKRGIVKGSSETEFNPYSLVTRQEMAVMVYNAIIENAKKDESVTNTNIIDRDLIAPWAMNAVDYLYSKNIISGRVGGLFDPVDNMTRAEVATVIYNVIK